jgi:uncharacterized NAD(P)/FAD-binding protein YdhS
MTIESTGPVIVQIGRGPTGTALARHLLPALPAGARYLVIDRDPAATRLAFGTPEPTHLLNTRAGRSSLNRDDPDEFQRWLIARSAPDPAPEFPPRALYGRYVREVFDQAVRAAEAAGVVVELVSDNAVRIVRDGARTQVHCASGRVLDADRVVTCLGMMAASEPYPELADHPSYFAHPWPLPPLPKGATIAVIGTRLTAIDVYLTLAARWHTGPVLLASRSGRLPRIRGAETAAAVPHLQRCMQLAVAAGTLSLVDFGRALVADVEAASATPPDWERILADGPTTQGMLAADLAEVDTGVKRGWQQVLNAAGPLCARAWQLLTDRDRAEVLAKWLTPILVHGAPMPPPTARRVLAGMDSGRLRVLAGLRSVGPLGKKFELVTKHGRHEVHVVVNATGGGTDVAAMRSQPLVAAMLDDGLLTAHSLGGARIDVSTFEPLDASGAPVRGIHLVGDLARGAMLITNDVNALVAQAAQAAGAIRAGMAATVLS